MWIRLSLRSAFLGEVTTNLIAVGFGISEQTIHGAAVFDEIPNEQDI